MLAGSPTTTTLLVLVIVGLVTLTRSEDCTATCNTLPLHYCNHTILPPKLCYLDIPANAIALSTVDSAVEASFKSSVGQGSWNAIVNGMEALAGEELDPLPGCKGFYKSLSCVAAITNTPYLVPDSTHLYDPSGNNVEVCMVDGHSVGNLPCFSNCIDAHSNYCGVSSLLAGTICTGLSTQGQVAGLLSRNCYNVNLAAVMAEPPSYYSGDSSGVPPPPAPPASSGVSPSSGYVGPPISVTTGQALTGSVSGTTGGNVKTDNGNHDIAIAAGLIAAAIMVVGLAVAFVLYKRGSSAVGNSEPGNAPYSALADGLVTQDFEPMNIPAPKTKSVNAENNTSV